MRAFIACAAGLFFALSAGASVPDKLTIRFFGSSTCGECLEIREKLLLPLVQRHPDSLALEIYDVETDSGLRIVTSFEKAYGVKTTAAQELFFPDTVLIGYEAIMKNGRAFIEQRLAHPDKWRWRHRLRRQHD